MSESGIPATQLSAEWFDQMQAQVLAAINSAAMPTQLCPECIEQVQAQLLAASSAAERRAGWIRRSLTWVAQLFRRS